MINVPRLYSQRTGEAWGGAGCRNFARLQLGGEIFFLTSSFIEPAGGLLNRSGTRRNRPTLPFYERECQEKIVLPRAEGARELVSAFSPCHALCQWGGDDVPRDLFRSPTGSY